ncbi:hypothetical protein M438DRAFT_408305 [Aureobasidium pullulans EXF-150]|uniref:Uncharacterized protein n=1 Tax=Aureobasidium pullulans EXF-150 TaxID=1043002 RepID=A0A074X689_AURPU|nr:uncharacterized protein M438DRAFT_408305 [Aureobasidium pullulans EXF-150]KEQ81020.1 hypothetical protein M438DRAFT_408305 [Aureobasidium pullulans EXF-150]
MIYAHIPTNTGPCTYDIHMHRKTPHWNPDTVGTPQSGQFFEEKHHNPGVAFGSDGNHNAILLTCRTIHSEALPILYASTPLALWRPMYDYGGREHYHNFLDKVFDSLPTHAAKHIRILQLQGEVFQKSMQVLLELIPTKLPALKYLEMVVDPYYEDLKRRRQWFDDRAFARQMWPAISCLHLVADKLEEIHITLSPPKDGVYINLPTGQGNWLSGKKYKHFLWSYLQTTVLRYEITIHNSLQTTDAKKGMQFFMDVLENKRRDLFEIYQRGMGEGGVEAYLEKLAGFGLQDEKEWMRRVSGRVVEEIDGEEGRVVVREGDGEGGRKWCRIVYTMAPRGIAGEEGLLLLGFISFILSILSPIYP